MLYVYDDYQKQNSKIKFRLGNFIRLTNKKIKLSKKVAYNDCIKIYFILNIKYKHDKFKNFSFLTVLLYKEIKRCWENI